MFQSRGISRTELATVFVPFASKFFSGSVPHQAVEIGLFPGSCPVRNDLGHKVDPLDEAAVAEADEDDAADLVIEEFD